MHADLLIVQICEFLDTGDGVHRIHEPSQYLARLPGVVVVDCHFLHRHAPWLMEHADVLVLPFVHNWELLPLIEQRRRAGHVTVFEANDDFYDVQTWNPVAETWRNPAVRHRFEMTMAACDAVQTSTAVLAELWKSIAKHVAVFPNQLTSIPPMRDPPDRPLTIGWGGSPGHFADWYATVPVLSRWLKTRPNVRLAVRTNPLAKPFFDLPPERYQFTAFGSFAQYMEFLKSVDIGLAPLLPTNYNRGRSDVKFLEYAASGVAGIYADLEPYRQTVVEGETGLFYSRLEDLPRRLDALADDSALRQRIRHNAYEQVSKHRRLEDHAGQQLAFYRDMLPGDFVGRIELPKDIVAAATVVDQRYLQMRPGEPERALLAALRDSSSKQSMQAMEELVQRHPEYHRAVLLQAKQFNDAKQFDRAMPAAERARALVPSSVAALCEMGRTHYLRKDSPAAMKCFVDAVELNPAYYPGWEYLLRFLRFTKHADAPQWAAKARAQFPGDLPLALLAIALHPPTDQVAQMKALLEDGTTIAQSNVVATLPMFTRMVMELLAAIGPTDGLIAMLAQACDAFPGSARLADVMNRCLSLRGQLAEAALYCHRALAIRETARMYQNEFAPEDGSFHLWQIGEHAGAYGDNLNHLAK